MSLCVDSVTLTFTGVRDIGEALSFNITRFCLDSSPNYPVEAFDSINDTTFTFNPTTDGSFRVQYIGNVNGVLQTDIILVKTNSNKDIGHLACIDTKKLIGNDCLDNEYMYKKALSAMADAFEGCDRYCEAESKLFEIVNFDDCSNNLKDCGCS